MKTLKIYDDNDSLSIYEIVSANLRSDEENDRVLYLKFITATKEVIAYRICSDTREPDIEKIRDFLDTKLNEENFTIWEYLRRAYIYIDSGDDMRRQFTAQRA